MVELLDKHGSAPAGTSSLAPQAQCFVRPRSFLHGFFECFFFPPRKICHGFLGVSFQMGAFGEKACEFCLFG